VSPNFRHLQEMIDEIDDAEIRARLRREYGLVGLDSNGRPGLVPAARVVLEGLTMLHAPQVPHSYPTETP
jgi:hypothetical protein